MYSHILVHTRIYLFIWLYTLPRDSLRTLPFLRRFYGIYYDKLACTCYISSHSRILGYTTVAKSILGYTRIYQEIRAYTTLSKYILVHTRTYSYVLRISLYILLSTSPRDLPRDLPRPGTFFSDLVLYWM